MMRRVAACALGGIVQADGVMSAGERVRAGFRAVSARLMTHQQNVLYDPHIRLLRARRGCVPSGSPRENQVTVVSVTRYSG